MKVIVINESDITALIASLELEKFKLTGSQKSETEIHRRFHYLVVSWFQKQGSSYPRK